MSHLSLSPLQEKLVYFLSQERQDYGGGATEMLSALLFCSEAVERICIVQKANNTVETCPGLMA